MRRRCTLLLLFGLTGCLTTPTDREIKETKLQVTLMEQKLQLKELEARYCEQLRRHAHACVNSSVHDGK